MKRPDVLSWLHRVQGQQNPTPPSSPPPNELDNDHIHHQKRRKMSHNGTSTPQKRRRTQDDMDLESLSTLTDRTKFEPSVQSASGQPRQRSPARDLLNDLPLSNPPIHCTRPKEILLPSSTLSLRRTLCQSFGSRVIPIGLKVSFHHLYHLEFLHNKSRRHFLGPNIRRRSRRCARYTGLCV